MGPKGFCLLSNAQEGGYQEKRARGRVVPIWKVGIGVGTMDPQMRFEMRRKPKATRVSILRGTADGGAVCT